MSSSERSFVILAINLSDFTDKCFTIYIAEFEPDILGAPILYKFKYLSLWGATLDLLVLEELSFLIWFLFHQRS